MSRIRILNVINEKPVRLKQKTHDKSASTKQQHYSGKIKKEG